MTEYEIINQLSESLLVYKLRNMVQELHNIRDEQETIVCDKHEPCICNRFDNIIDALRELITEFKLI